VLTFGGTLAANVVTVLVIAIAIIVSRYTQSPRFNGGEHVTVGRVAVVSVGFAVITDAPWRLALRGSARRPGVQDRAGSR
jgi:hypothetical protein